MPVTIRPADARGHANHGWLDTFHTFSFADYHDPAHMGFRTLRVINDDVVEPSAGFGTHGHRDMEIVTYLVRGALAHEDSTGAKGVLRRGDVQAMSAGTGVRHSEFNASHEEEVRLLQIWVLPERRGLPAAYAQHNFPDEAKRNTLKLVAGAAGRDGTLVIHQDARIYASLLDEGRSVSHSLAPGRAAWLQMVDGSVELNGARMGRGDGAAIEELEGLDIVGRSKAEFLLFDLA
jgi:hypothetical protein